MAIGTIRFTLLQGVVVVNQLFPDEPLGLSNAFGALAALLFFIISATVLLHRLFWPVLRRPVMAAHRHGLLQQRKLLGGAGVALLGHASPVGQWLEQSLKSVHISFGG